MKDICKVFCLGRITQQPSLKKSDKGDFLTFSIAVHHNVRNGDAWEDVSNFYNVSTWQTNLLSYLTVGNRIALVGELTSDKFKNKNGEEKISLKIKATDIQFVSEREDVKTEGIEEEEKPQAKAKTITKPKAKASDPDNFNEEELPF